MILHGHANGDGTVEFIDSLHEQWGDRESEQTEIELLDDGEFTLMETVTDRDSLEEDMILTEIHPAMIEMGFIAGMFLFSIGSVAIQIFKKSETYKILERWTEDVLGKIFARVSWNEKGKTVTVKGLRYDRLLQRVGELYKDKGFAKMFGRNHRFFQQLAYDIRWKKKLAVEDISSLEFHHFFALEIAKMFEELGGRFGFSYYYGVSAMLWKRTWLKNFVVPVEVAMLDLGPLAAFNSAYVFKDYQKEFIQKYPQQKVMLNLRGTVLAFDQGLGKTLVACGLGECLGKTRVYVVCPNTLRENWLKELASYFTKYNDPAVLQREVYIHGSKNQVYSGKDTKYVVVNNEAIEKIFFTIQDCDPAKTLMILDEGQNFRNLTGKRTATLVELRDRLGCDDVLPMSGTPIKASPNEIVPVLLLIDKLFDMTAAKTYNALFAVDDVATKNIVRERFGRIIYRKRKADVLSLPKKHELTITVGIEDQDKYLLENVTKLVNQRFLEIYSEKLKGLTDLRSQYLAIVTQYSTSGVMQREKYLGWVRDFASYGAKSDWHELTVNDMEVYADKYIVPNLPSDKVKDFKVLHMQLLTTRRSAMGEAVGEIVPKYRRDMYLAVWRENRNEFIKRIRDNPQKTVIFSIFLDVIKEIHADLQGEVGSVLIVGETKDRMAQIERFRNDDDIDAICATSQTMSTGVTLVEANQVFFFGTPWRSTDYDQASDRVHRIGQLSEVYIYNVVLSSTKPNLSTRMQDILSWSDKMFGTMIDNRND